jgi:hypothetical protein
MSKQQEDAEDKPVDRSRERREDMGDELTASDDEDIGPVSRRMLKAAMTTGTVAVN